MSSSLRDIPSVDRLLERCEEHFTGQPRALLARTVRDVVQEIRGRIAAGIDLDVGDFFANGSFLSAVETRLQELGSGRHRSVINATGVLLHTGLGRAPLSANALKAVQHVGRYGVVEIDPQTGQRSEREAFVRELLVELTGAESATVVNNNAAAVLLMLRALARNREVVVSRGELVEIGGGFRVPHVMEESGAKLREVGTTNRTHLHDFEAAIHPDTAMLLRIHSSNFKLVGFTKLPEYEEMVGLGKQHDVPVCADVGSGYLRRLASLPFAEEPTVQEAVGAGMDLVTFSGDKMLGGPQCGILVGRADLVTKIRKQPMFRALRPDKMTLAALEATLLSWRAAGEDLPPGIPFYEAMSTSLTALRERADRLLAALTPATPSLKIVASKGQVGSGSVPGLQFDSIAIAIAAKGGAADQLAATLRQGEPPVFVRVHEDRVLIDLRTVAPSEDDALTRCLKMAITALADP